MRTEKRRSDESEDEDEDEDKDEDEAAQAAEARRTWREAAMQRARGRTASIAAVGTPNVIRLRGEEEEWRQAM